jgi:penicillin-binding protein 2
MTGIELAGEQSGLIPDPDWKRLVYNENWATGDTYIGTIGQGFVTSTPIQVMQSVAVLANDGKMVKPTLIKEIQDPEGRVVKAFETQQIADITQENQLRCSKDTNKCSIDTLKLCNLESGTCKRGDSGSDFDEEIDPDYYPKMGGVITVMDSNGDATGETKTVAPWVIQLVKQGMRLVVTEGTAKEQLGDSVTRSGYVIESAGKTGTAEYCDDLARAQLLCEVRGQWPAHAWYAGYAPYDNPEIVVMAFVYHGEEGSVFAGPIVRKVLEAYFELKAVDAGTAGMTQ